MAETLERNAEIVLRYLASRPRDGARTSQVRGEEIVEGTRLAIEQINDAITILEEAGLVQWRQWIGTAPWVFGTVGISPRGRYEAERAAAPPAPVAVDFETSSNNVAMAGLLHPPSPVGSPYGFQEEDWEALSERRSKAAEIRVVMGYQFASEYYDANRLVANVRGMFEQAWLEYQAEPAPLPGRILFEPLAAGYGEHLFNEIVRDIISADIAVFDTSDLNPNVMIEMGVALTWGVRVLPIKESTRPKPPSDVSGQTWADYSDSGESFLDPEHSRKLLRMVERARKKKGRS